MNAVAACPDQPMTVTETQTQTEAQTTATATAQAAPQKRGGGPKTAAGRAASARNALKTGLRAKVLLPKELEEAAEVHFAQLTEQYHPATEHQVWLIEQ